MPMKFEFLVSVELERTEGKFAPKDEVTERLTEFLEQANEGSVDGVGADGESVYEIIDWDVRQVVRKP
jgi:hypothetical protein